MTVFKDIEQITARDPDTGDTVQTIIVPDGYVLRLISQETAAIFAEWNECAAIRIVTSEDGTVGALEVASDMEWLTSPEAER